MHPTIADELQTVERVLASGVSCAGVDAFALALLKVERQARRLLTFLVFQSDAFDRGDAPVLRAELAASRKVYFPGLLDGLDALYAVSVGELVGAEHDHLRKRITVATGHRNKFFHGQLPAEYLGGTVLRELVWDMRRWCELLGDAADREVGYTGFGPSSFHKSTDPGIKARLRLELAGVEEYRSFIRRVLEQTPQERSLGQVLAAMPNVGHDKDFQRGG